MPCGVIPAEHHAPFLELLHNLIRQAEMVTGNSRSAAGGKQGHQKTPAFVHALALKALEITIAEAEAGSGSKDEAEEVEPRQPRGGFTDVGLHTGGTPRDTAWPLVREALKVGTGHSGVGMNSSATGITSVCVIDAVSRLHTIL
jgi:hypothetical protein